MTYVNEKQSSLSPQSRQKPHPYLHGNFAPIHKVLPLTPCSYTGTIPRELAGGQYVRNGGNPVTNEDLGRDAHWFDGDGMLSGVSFRRTSDGGIQPEFVNAYLMTDIYLSSVTTPELRIPVLPSIATLVNPASTLLRIILRIFRTLLLVLISHLPGSQQAVKRISSANTGFLFHDGRALATCEAGPPLRVSLPTLETVGWFDGNRAENEPPEEQTASGDVFGGDGFISFMKEWTTAHPRVDPLTQELILFHSTFFAPFVYYSILPSTQGVSKQQPRIVNAGVPGIESARMMHDFGVSFTHTIIMDLPLSLDPRNLAKNKPIITYDPAGKSRFGVFPRWNPEAVRWFETNPCCIFHTANTWDEMTINPVTKSTEVIAVNMLACRLTSASLVYSAGDVAVPVPRASKKVTYEKEEEQCRLYYYRFSFSDEKENHITHQFALSTMPFEFPSLRDDVSMSNARYVYGCSVSDSTFGAALGRAVKIDSLVKVDIHALLKQAEKNPPRNIVGCVDNRSVAEILASKDPDDPIKIFKLPPGYYAQESRFVPRATPAGEEMVEDDGYILSYVFNESQLLPDGTAPSTAKSELWVVDAKDMKTVVCRVHLPQRVPYGLHGSWFKEDEILSQRGVERYRMLPVKGKGQILGEDGKIFDDLSEQVDGGVGMDIWMGLRRRILRAVG